MIKSSRNQNTGAHLTKDVKKALKEEATTLHITMSRLIYEILCERYGLNPIHELKKAKS